MTRFHPMRSVVGWLFLLPPPVNAADIFVAPQGADAAAGTRQAPLRALEQARDLVRRMRAQSPEEPVTVWLAGGDYVLSRPLTLSADDSGSSRAPTLRNPWVRQDRGSPVLQIQYGGKTLTYDFAKWRREQR